MIGRLDEQFHSAIVESSGNALMIEINSHVCQGMQTFRSKTFQVEQNVKNAVMPHSNIMNAILARDAAQAEREMRAHLDKVRRSDPEHPCPGTPRQNNRNCPARQFETPSRTGAAGDFFCVPAEKRTRSGSGSGVLDLPGRRAGSRGKPALYNMLRNLRKRESRAEISTKMREEFCRLFPLTS